MQEIPLHFILACPACRNLHHHLLLTGLTQLRFQLNGAAQADDGVLLALGGYESGYTYLLKITN